jgi:hypothetical protein
MLAKLIVLTKLPQQQGGWLPSLWLQAEPARPALRWLAALCDPLTQCDPHRLCLWGRSCDVTQRTLPVTAGCAVQPGSQGTGTSAERTRFSGAHTPHAPTPHATAWTRPALLPLERALRYLATPRLSAI